MAQNIGSSTALAAGPATADKLTAMRHGPMSVVLTTDPVSITPDSPGCHEHYEFFLPINVMQKLFIEDCSIDCHPGQIVPINPGQLHGFRHGNRAVSFILLQFEVAYLSNLASEMLPADAVAAAGWPPAFENAPFAISPEIQALGAYIIREFDERRPGRDRLIPSLTEVLAIMLVRTCFSKMTVAAPARQVLQSERYLRFRQVIEHMQNHLAEKISIDNLAEIAGMNRFHFIRTFKSAYSQSPYDYLTDLRIERASQLLRASELSAAEIASQCGFFSASRFSAAFRLATGTTPSHYRSAILTDGSTRPVSAEA